MRPSFCSLARPYLAAIVQESTADATISAIINSEHDGAQGFMVALHSLQDAERTPENLRRIFHCSGRPMMPLVYRNSVMTADRFTDDARVELMMQALEAGAAGIVVSNHGGRVQDGVPATAAVLPAIADAVKGKMTILVDGGIRNGVDVCKALALGADACILARPYVTAVYGGGEEGVKVLTDKLRAELADTMAMCGVHSLGEISRDMIF